MFQVWISRTDGATRVRVDGLDNTHWLLSQLSRSFVFKTCEPLRDLLNSSVYTFSVADNSADVVASQLQKLLGGISELRVSGCRSNAGNQGHGRPIRSLTASCCRSLRHGLKRFAVAAFLPYAFQNSFLRNTAW